MAWKKGQSGNKGGRGKGVKTYADHARKLCGDGLKISVFWYSIWTRNAKALKEFGIKADKITLDHQMDAAKRLEERGFGRPVQGVDFGDGTGLVININQDLRRRFD